MKLTQLPICRITAAGKVCLIEAETVAAAQAMRARGLQAHFVHLRPASDSALRAAVESTIGAAPLVDYNPAQAVTLFYEHACQELAAADAAAREGLWDADIVLQEDPEAAYCCLMEAIADKFQSIVPPCHVWGYGRQLWDRSRRVHGRRPLCVLVLGPAASGKTTLAAPIAQRFGLVHISAGDLLYSEVQRRTDIGRRAKRYLDASQLVPDDIMNALVGARLGAPDARDAGYVLDGYPHTRSQVDYLMSAGFEPDKVHTAASSQMHSRLLACFSTIRS